MKPEEMERYLTSGINTVRNALNAYGNLIVASIVILLFLAAVFFLLRRSWPQAITLPLLAIAIAFWFWSVNRPSVAGLLQAFAAIILIGVTWAYVIEANRSRVSQERGTELYIRELQESRSQQIKPYVYIFFYWTQNLGKFMAILQNVGVGPAFDVEYSYELIDNQGKTVSHSERCRILAAGRETVDMTPFSSDHVNAKNKVKVKISYKDAFGHIVNDEFEHSLRELTNNPPPSDYAKFRRELESQPSPIRAETIETLRNDALTKIKEDISGIRKALEGKRD